MIKPAGYMYDNSAVFGIHDISSLTLEKRIKEGRVTPLYAIPEGYALVPIEPTEEMLKVYADTSIAPISTLSKHGYKAMLKALIKPEDLT